MKLIVTCCVQAQLCHLHAHRGQRLVAEGRRQDERPDFSSPFGANSERFEWSAARGAGSTRCAIAGWMDLPDRSDGCAVNAYTPLAGTK